MLHNIYGNWKYLLKHCFYQKIFLTPQKEEIIPLFYHDLTNI